GALERYQAWQINIQLVGVDDALRRETAEAKALLVSCFNFAIATEDQKCFDHNDWRPLVTVFRWQSIAEELGLAQPATGLLREDVLFNLPARVVILQKDFPDTIAPGE